MLANSGVDVVIPAVLVAGSLWYESNTYSLAYLPKRSLS